MLAPMSAGTDFEQVLQRSLAGCSLREDGYEFLKATREGASVVVFFRYRDEAAVHAVRLDVSPPLLGPSTGEPCRTVRDWAWEVRLVLDEEVGTRDLERRSRTLTPDGVVLVDM
jgi:hypothetical protein